MTFEDLIPSNPKNWKITDLIDQITKIVPEVKEIWLHGSRARGDFKSNSDWDFLAVLPDDTSSDRIIDLAEINSPLANLNRVLNTQDRIDINVARENEKQTSGSVAYWANSEGILLYTK